MFALTNAYTSDIKWWVNSSDVYVDVLSAGVLMKNVSGDQYMISIDNAGDVVTSLNNNAVTKAEIEGDFYVDTDSRGLILKRSATAYTLLNVNGLGALNTTNTSMPSSANTLIEGNIGFIHANSGIVFKSNNGNCYKLYVDEAGDACTTQVPCET